MKENEVREKKEDERQACEAKPEAKCDKCGCETLVPGPCGLLCPVCGDGGCEG